MDARKTELFGETLLDPVHRFVESLEKFSIK